MDVAYTKRIVFNCSEKQHRQLKRLVEQGHYGSFPPLIRAMLFKRRIKVDTYDVTYDKLLEQLAAIRTALQGIDLSMNQFLIDVQKMESPRQRELQASHILKQHRVAVDEMEALFDLITKIAERCEQT